MPVRIAAIHVTQTTRRFLKPFRNAKVHMETLDYLRVDLCGDDGSHGHAEMTAMPGYSSETIASMRTAIEVHFAPVLLQMEALKENDIIQALRQTLPGNPYAHSVVELALLDLRARLLGAPAHALLGGATRNEVPLGAIVTLDTPAAMAEEARYWHALGARTLQVKVALDAQSSLARVDAIHQAIGSDTVIAIDGNGSFQVVTALQTMKVLERYNVGFFEQPVPAWDIQGMATLCRAGLIPIVADESLFTAHDALRIVQERAADGFNLKLAKSGIRETQRIMAIADAAGIPYGLGAMLETPFGSLAGIHFAATLRQPLFPAELVGPWKMRDPRIPDGWLSQDDFAWKVPSSPGWGGTPED